jgi:hypothetical protein
MSHFIFAINRTRANGYGDKVVRGRFQDKAFRMGFRLGIFIHMGSIWGVRHGFVAIFNLLAMKYDIVCTGVNETANTQTFANVDQGLGAFVIDRPTTRREHIKGTHTPSGNADDDRWVEIANHCFCFSFVG